MANLRARDAGGPGEPGAGTLAARTPSAAVPAARQRGTMDGGRRHLRGTDPDTLHGHCEPWKKIMTGLRL